MTRRIVGKGVICTLLLLAAAAAVHSQTAAVSSDPVMRAMVNELERSVNELQFKDLDKPYFIQYVILDQERYRASATFGALTSSDTSRGRAFVQNKVRAEQIPDFSKEAAVTAVGTRRTLDLDKTHWEKQVREWSNLFKRYPEIQQSRVVFEAQVMHRYLVNSEGTRTLQPSMLVAIFIEAASEAPDGMRVRHWIPFNASSFDQVPSVEEVSKSIAKMAADLTALRAAPVLEADYSGPVLFTGQASAEMFARVLAPNLSGQRLPLTDQQQAQTNRSELVDRLNRPVLPRFLSVFDDPTAQRIGNQELLGHYQVDDQGVPARRVSLIEQGVLKNFLMSRRPGKDMLQSNGHGRSVVPGRETAQIGNLFIQSKEGKSYEDLKQELIKMCREENLQYGILIKALDTDTRSPIGTPVLTYKVYVVDGREELIRGAFAQEIPIRSLRQIEAVGDDSFVVNRLSGGELPTPTSIVAPSVLLEEIELKKPSGNQQKPALLTHPYFDKN